MSMAIVTLKKGEGRTLKAGGAWIYDNEIENIHSGLDMYRWGHDGKAPDYDGDIIKIKEKLINYKDNLEM